MKNSITTDQFTAAMREAVAERGGDFVYPHGAEGWGSRHGLCSYVREDVAEPACLIGVALYKCGVPLSELSKWEDRNAYHVLGEITDLPKHVTCAASLAQGVQDSRGSWGRALEAYEYLTANESEGDF